MRIKAGQYFASLILFLENLLKAHPQTENCLGQLFFCRLFGQTCSMGIIILTLQLLDEFLFCMEIDCTSFC